jgi:hypothetical protein
MNMEKLIAEATDPPLVALRKKWQYQEFNPDSVKMYAHWLIQMMDLLVREDFFPGNLQDYIGMLRDFVRVPLTHNSGIFELIQQTKHKGWISRIRAITQTIDRYKIAKRSAALLLQDLLETPEGFADAL